ncbi:MAG: serine protease [bacterium]|nr:serine protease [bacterium]
MPTWSGIMQEILTLVEAGNPLALDIVRRKYLVQLHGHTGRSIILYSTAWTPPNPNVPSFMVSISDEDLQGIMEVICKLPGPNLDLILHSPGGSLEAAEALVKYLRSKFEHIRVMVPQLAMSAATMIACAADEIVLGKHSFLGPIDPQIIVATPLGPRMIAAQDILDQFELAKKECQDPAKMGAWLPMLSQYGPDLLVQCSNTQGLSKELVTEWLQKYMFKNDNDRNNKAASIANWLSDHSHFKTHGRHISRAELEARGLKIVALEEDQDLQDLLLSIFHATMHTFSMTAAVKIIENHMGKAFIKQQQMIVPFQGKQSMMPTNPLQPDPTTPDEHVANPPADKPKPKKSKRNKGYG